MAMGIFRKTPKNIIKAGFAARVVFYYPGENGTYLDGAWVRVYDSGVVDVHHPKEQVTTHIQNIEIIWKNDRPERNQKKFTLHNFENQHKTEL